MANEFLRRTPTSTGNRRVWTFSYWIKKNSLGNAVSFYTTQASTPYLSVGDFYSTDEIQVCRNESATVTEVVTKNKFRDVSSWMHILIIWDTTHIISSNRAKLFVNGVEQKDFQNGSGSSAVFPTQNYEGGVNRTVEHDIGTVVTGAYPNGYPGTFVKGEMTDVFLVDGQALTPDVFGFYKQGKGYISAGSAQATDFRPGQWVPKTPRVIKTEINRRGGFGVNGFYLPMNDSKNFGADFHGDPNSIITLNEKLPQPRVGVASTASVGLGYTDALRADPYAANLVLALPFVSGGLQSGLGDCSHIIRNTGTAKTFVWNSGSTAVSTATTSSYYGSAGNFPGGTVGISTSADFKMDGSFTVECWFNSGNFNGTSGNHIAQGRDGKDGGDNWILSQGGTGGSSVRFLLRNDNGTNAKDLDVAISSLSTNQWHHFAGVYDNSKRQSMVFLNGVVVGVGTDITWTRNNTTTLLVGSNDSNPTGAGGNRNVNGYLQDLRIYKGVAKYTGGFDVPRPYTPVGIATWRQVPDTTANNFATMNPLIEARPSSGTDSPASSTIVTFAGGNLDLTNSASSGNAQRMVSFATIGISTGRWYWEVRAGTNDRVGISKGFQQKNYGGNLGGGSGLEATVTYEASGAVSFANTAFGSVTTLTPPSFDTTNIIGVAVSANNGLNNLTIQFFKDGVGVTTLTGVGATSPVLEWFPSKMMQGSGSGSDQKFNFGQNPTFSGNITEGTFTDTNGKGLFKYQPPSGFLALCEDNLPTPAISDPGKYFKTVLYTGDGNSGRSIVGVGFTPDLVWVKSRTNTNFNNIADSVRGTGRLLYTNSTVGEEVNTGIINSFNSDGFGVGSDNSANQSSQNFVAWCWRAGAGTTSTNTNGSITSVVSVNQDAGFSIVSFTGTGAQGTFGHGLGKTPKFIVMKRRTGGTNNWSVYHSSLGLSHTTYPNWLYLNATSSEQSSVSSANHPLYQRPDSSLIYLNTGTSESTNVSGSTYIAYCWAEIENFSKFGSYVGNGNADGPFVYCGFKPAIIIFKNISAVGNWVMKSNHISSNPNGYTLLPDASDTEYAPNNTEIDFLSNGFKNRTTSSLVNGSGNTIIFAAFAESPFQTANSK